MWYVLQSKTLFTYWCSHLSLQFFIFTLPAIWNFSFGSHIWNFYWSSVFVTEKDYKGNFFWTLYFTLYSYLFRLKNPKTAWSFSVKICWALYTNLFLKSLLSVFIISLNLWNLFINMVQDRLARMIFFYLRKILVNMVSDPYVTMEQNAGITFL